MFVIFVIIKNTLTNPGEVMKKLRKALKRQTTVVTQIARLVRANNEAPARDTLNPAPFRAERYRNRYQ